MLRDNVLTSFASLASSNPSASAQTIWLDELKYVDPNRTDVTVWMDGFLVVARDSEYQLSVSSNGAAILYLSTDSTEANKQLVASVNGATVTNNKVTLQASKSYYIKLVASKSGGALTVSANAKMFNSKLNGKISSMVKTEVQEIEISSNVIPEKTVI